MKKYKIFDSLFTASLLFLSAVLPTNIGVSAKADTINKEINFEKADVNKDGLISVGDLSLGYSEKLLTLDNAKAISKNMGFYPYKRTLIIGIDGTGNAFYPNAPYYGNSTIDTVRSTPFINSLFEKGAVTHNSMVDMPSNSAPGWIAALHGYSFYEADSKYQIINETAESKPYPSDSPYPSIFKIAKQEQPNRRAASFSNWSGINTGIIENNIGAEFFSGKDDEVTSQLIDYIKSGKAKESSMLYVHLNDVDYAGHTAGWFGDEFYKALTAKDKNVKDIVNAMEEANLLEDSLIILTTDHGGRDMGHGNEHPETMTTFISFYGPTIPSNKLLDGGKQKDIPTIISKAMGYKPADTWTGTLWDKSLFLDQRELLNKSDAIPSLRLLQSSFNNKISLVLDNLKNEFSALDVTLSYDPSKIKITNFNISSDIKIINNSQAPGTLRIILLGSELQKDIPLLNIQYNYLGLRSFAANSIKIEKVMAADKNGNETLLSIK
ncbi:alkaline phosphatase family protein [Clostridium polynesiense]|uniref:alkaline phosphatase family protein n=1 Tax=Clostridium polynesiense TaxID=1325933 RepID=UPI000590CA57|nr:alkaline phosphatase family protein [Clostridium polynesiense]